MELNTKYGTVKVFAKTVETDAISQIIQMANSPLAEDANIRIMPDAHAGAGCVIGTTMQIINKVCPNLVGVDIGCGVSLVKTDIDFSRRLSELDSVIRKYVPFGTDTHKTEKYFDFSKLLCWNALKQETQNCARLSLGTLGGGNHFIEAYKDGYLSVHSGSRNIGWRVAQYYQILAEKQCVKKLTDLRKQALITVPTAQRESYLKQHKISVPKDLCYLEEQGMASYLHDLSVMQQFADANRQAMLIAITEAMNGKITEKIDTVHNYIDLDNMILRKGAISAQKGELLVIPLNMRDGLLVCRGKGNADWNFSAPHGAGRLYSRSAAKQAFTVAEYKSAMKGIFTTCINESTLDEAPFAYKDYTEITSCIQPTVDILDRLLPIYNFKAN